MNCGLKIFFIISLSLFIYVSKGISQETSSNNSDQTFLQAVLAGNIERVTDLLESGGITSELVRSAAMSAAYKGKGDILKFLMEEEEKASHICPDYMFNVRIEYFYQTPPGQNVNTRFAESYGDVGETIRLDLSFSLQRYSNLTPSIRSIAGLATAMTFTISDNDSLSGASVEGPGFTIVAYMIRDAIRDGYEQLRNEYEQKREQGFLQQQLITSTVSELWDNRIQIPLGRSHYIQRGDVFNIYGNRVKNYRNHCGISRLHGPPLTTATVVEVIDQDNAILEVNDNSVVQVGDIVTRSVDLESRSQASMRILKLSVPRAFVAFHSSDGILTEDITPYIRYFLVTEAGVFGFQVIYERE